MLLSKIHQITQSIVASFKIINNLGLMFFRNLGYCFKLNNDSTIAQEIHIKIGMKRLTIIF